MRGSKVRVGFVVAALMGALLPVAPTAVTASAGVAPAPAAAAANTRPNVLLLISDDQAWTTFSRKLMPSVYSQLVDQGVLFNRAYVNTSLCCPSRAQIVTGLYEHNTGVDANEIVLTRPTLPMALHDVGYRTMLAGKYMNSWPCIPRAEFDEWACVATPEVSSLSMIDPMVNVDGIWQRRTGYEPDILASMASDFIAETPADQPFFVMYSPTTPHLPADDQRYAAMPVSPPRGPSFNNNTMTNATPPFSRRAPLSPEEIANSDENYTAMAHATRSFDDAVGSLVDSLGDRSRDTLVIYLSDNGFLYGEHRRTGKNDPWEESVKVPMVVRYPAALSADQAFASNALVQNVDIAPTIAELAGLRWVSDGQSFLPVLQRRRATVRTAALIEHCRGPSQGTADCSGLSYNGGRVRTPGFQGIVTSRYKYVEIDDGSVQLVDLKKDPLELKNLAASPALSNLRRALANRLHDMLRPGFQTTLVTGPGPLTSRVASFSFFSPSRFASYRCRLLRNRKPAPWRDCPGGFVSFGDLADGRYLFEVAAVAENGHVDPTPASRPFKIVASGPDVELVSHPEFDQTGSSAAFTYASQARDVVFQCRLVPSFGVAPWEPCDPAGTSYSELEDGEYRFEVRARDQADEVSDPAAGWFFRIDNTGPIMLFSNAPGIATRRTNASFRFGAQEPTVGAVTCTLDGKAKSCPDGLLRMGGLSEREHTLAVKATDAAGNVGVSLYAWTVDLTAPEVLIADGPSQSSSEEVSSFNLWSSTEPALFACSLDGGPTMPCFGAPEFFGLSDGRHILQAWSVDLAGNRSAAARYVWRIDGAVPRVTITRGPDEGSTQTSTSATFAVKVSENASLFCSLDGAPFSDCPVPIRFLSLASGTHVFEIYAVDEGGNASATVTRSWTVA